MPKGKGKTFRFYDAFDKVYPFYAETKGKAIHNALTWSRQTGIKLYRKRSES